MNFVLVRPPLSLSAMTLARLLRVRPVDRDDIAGGRAVQAIGTTRTIWLSFALAGAGLPLLLLPSLVAVLAGMVLIGVGTFFAQAAATGFVSRTATSERGSASGIYLACYFAGGMAGTAILGWIFDRFDGRPVRALALRSGGCLLASRSKVRQPDLFFQLNGRS